jgi:hypothetical protein
MVYNAGGGHGEPSEVLILECDAESCQYNAFDGYVGKRTCRKVKKFKVGADHQCPLYVKKRGDIE